MKALSTIYCGVEECEFCVDQECIRTVISLDQNGRCEDKRIMEEPLE